MKHALEAFVVALFCAAGCSSPEPSTSSETHFACTANAECTVMVGSGYQCIAGVCKLGEASSTDASADARGARDGSYTRDGSADAPVMALRDAGTGSGPCPTTGYAGDELCLPMPPEYLGLQLHYGPSNYDDPDEVAKFVQAPSEESFDCVIQSIPNPGGVYADGYRSARRPHAPFVSVNALSTAGNPSSTPAACNTGAGSKLFLTLTDASTSLSLDGFGSTSRGAAMHLPGGGYDVSIGVQSENTSDVPILEEVWINLTYKAGGATSLLADHAGAIDFMGGIGMFINPNTTTVVSPSHGESCAATEDRSIVVMSAEPNPRVDRTTIFVRRAGDTAKQTVFETYDFSHPTELRFDAATVNPAPNPTTKTPGGASGPLVIHLGDDVSWECEVRNDTAVNLKYSESTKDGAVCNVFGYAVWPTTGDPWFCSYL